MPVRNLRHYDEEFDYLELVKDQEITPIQDYMPEVEPAPQLSELLYFLNIAIFCVFKDLESTSIKKENKKSGLPDFFVQIFNRK